MRFVVGNQSFEFRKPKVSLMYDHRRVEALPSPPSQLEAGTGLKILIKNREESVACPSITGADLTEQRLYAFTCHGAEVESARGLAGQAAGKV